VSKKVIHKTATTTAPPAEIFPLLVDGATWPTWSPLDSFELEQDAPAGGDGLGAIRIFRTGRSRSREEVVAVEADHHFAYTLLEGLPLRGYRADITLEPTGGGTTITWHSEFDPKYPGTGWAFRLGLGTFIQRMVDGLAARTSEARAEQR
jgi:uncharacterized protein YndB with AHSA1/START domain